MAKNNLVFTDGASTKGINTWDVDSYPEAWNWLTGQPKTKQEEFYSTVSAVFRAFNLKANTVASVPFKLNKINSDEEFDNSNEWKNKVKFLPNPQELLRLDVLSYITSNTIYNLKTTDAVGYRTRNLYNVINSSFTPYINPATRQLEYISRQVGSTIERYKPDDKRLIRMWRLDHTTEVLPSPNTEAKAIMKAAGIIYYQDAWVEHFYRRGGIKATLVGMKGLIDTDSKEEKENRWSKFLKGVGSYFGKPAMIYNAESITTNTIGAGVDDMKDNKIYLDAIANIAMGTGMPLSLLLANSSNYATAQEEKATWYENDIIPLCRWMAYEYNRQLWNDMGLYMQFQPQTLDPNQQDETEKANAISSYIDIIVKCPTYEIFIGMADTIGIEISETLDSALKKYYAEKKEVVEVKPVDEQTDKPKEEPKEKVDLGLTKQWIPTLDELEEMRVWREVALRRFKKGESLDFEYQPHYGGLPNDVVSDIKTRLTENREWDIDALKLIFDLSKWKAERESVTEMLFAPEVKANEDVLKLAESINKLAESIKPTNV